MSLFLKNFLSLSASKKDHDEDDLLFFIRKKPTKIFQQYEVISIKQILGDRNFGQTLNLPVGGAFLHVQTAGLASGGSVKFQPAWLARQLLTSASLSNRPTPKTKLEVFRKDSKKMPIGELNVDYEETFYLNVSAWKLFDALSRIPQETLT